MKPTMVQTDPITAKEQPLIRPRAIALVDPDDRARRDLHLILSAQRHRVRAYDCVRALTHDCKSVEAEWLIYALRMDATAGAEDLAALGHWRSKGWQGRLALIADGNLPAAVKSDLIAQQDLVLTRPVAPHLWQICLAN